MDWTWLLLVATHLLALVAGLLLGRWVTVRNLEVVEHEGHLAVEIKHPHDE